MGLGVGWGGVGWGGVGWGGVGWGGVGWGGRMISTRIGQRSFTNGFGICYTCVSLRYLSLVVNIWIILSGMPCTSDEICIKCIGLTGRKTRRKSIQRAP